MSELALKLIQKAKETRATHLDLGNCGLTELPDALFELVDLKVLCTPPQSRKNRDFISFNIFSFFFVFY